MGFGRFEVQQEGERADVREPPLVHATAGGVDAPASLHPRGLRRPDGEMCVIKVQHELMAGWSGRDEMA